MLVAAFAPVAAESVAAAGHAPPAQNRTTPRLASQAKSDTLAERFETAPIRTLGAKEHLFCEGDPASHVYRVEAGHVVLYRTMPDGRRQVIDFAYPGDVIGLGALATHGHNAQATGTAVLRCLPVALLQALAGCDPRLGLKLYEA
ncbi:MAG TPA: cyclic nucleotide-binding domain-containing protein, partial [Hyphomicrobiaceae bacterium]|nr:cyclic nucleotide-binding domain-containing protein [Hyphomicrobiaceae bacterium]